MRTLTLPAWMVALTILTTAAWAQSEGEGEGAMGGEGAAEGEGMPEGEGSAEGEGETEGEGEGGPGGEPDCELETFELAAPSDGATWYLSSSAGGLEINLLAEADCEEDIREVQFFVQQSGSPRQPVGAPVNAPPFERQLSSFFSPPLGESLTLIAEATTRSDPDTPVTAESVVRFERLTAVDDADANGFPDEPFGLLGDNGDRWLSSITLDGQDEPVVTWMRTLDYDTLSTKQTGDDPSFGIRFTSPVDSRQEITATFDADVLNTGEIGIFVVRFAPTLAALAGATEAMEFTREPAGRLRGEGQYVLVSVLRSDDGGITFEQVTAGRLRTDPVELRIEGLELDTAREYTLASHPVTLQNLGAGLGLYAASGLWRSLATQSTDFSAGALDGTVVAPGVYAPYFLVDEDEFCPLGFCAPPIIVAEILSIFSFIILLFVPGGVGGGDSPCFVATAAYGTPMAAEIDSLRTVRDEVLLQSGLGTAFVDVYYRWSPGLADAIAERPLLAGIARALLYPFVVLARLWLAVPGASIVVFAGVLLALYRLRVSPSRGPRAR